MDDQKTFAGLIIGGSTGFIAVGAALLPVAIPAVIASSIAALGMIGGAFVGGTIGAKLSDAEENRRARDKADRPSEDDGKNHG